MNNYGGGYIIKFNKILLYKCDAVEPHVDDHENKAFVDAATLILLIMVEFERSCVII